MWPVSTKVKKSANDEPWILEPIKLVTETKSNRSSRALALCPLYPQKRTSELSHGMSALCGVFNRSTQHLLILLEEEVCDGGDCTDMVHAAAEG